MFSARDTLSQRHLWAADANIGKNDISPIPPSATGINIIRYPHQYDDISSQLETKLYINGYRIR
jgi:hypothetical protein